MLKNKFKKKIKLLNKEINFKSKKENNYFKNRIVKQPKHKGKGRIFLFWIFLIIILLLSLNELVNRTFLLPKFTIKNINFTENTILQHDDPYIFKEIKLKLMGKNYIIINYLNKNKIKKELKNKFENIEEINYYLIDDSKLGVDIKFYEPNLVFKDEFGFYGSKNGKLFDIFSGSSLLADKFIIELPNYFSTLDNLNGFFYTINEEKLISQINMIFKNFDIGEINKILYLPGGSKTIIFLTNNKELYFDNQNDFYEQIQKYKQLIKNYDGFNEIKKIDLGSLNGIIIY